MSKKGELLTWEDIQELYSLIDTESSRFNLTGIETPGTPNLASIEEIKNLNNYI